MNDKTGAIWRKWDLHFHTPSSFDYQNKGLTNKDIIDGLKAASISAIAITDHHFMDVGRIKELQKIAGNDLTVFPAIELRSELGGSESVHFIGIFPENCDLDDIWTKLSVHLKITPADVKAKGDDRVYCDFADAASVIHELGGLVSVHAGRKSNSIENIGNEEKFKQAVKTDLAREAIDLYEIGKVTDIEGYRTIVFPHIKKEIPLIICSDNHDAKNYVVKANLWIKADTTFEGLRQVVNEPQARCFIGDTPPKVIRVRENKTKYLRSLKIEKNAGSTLKETWFNNDIPLNPDLVAIIGNKGKGKSALADTIGLLTNTKQSKAFSFLSEKNFRNPKDNKAKHFTATATWESGHTHSISLDAAVDETRPELIKYIPQNFLEKICNEIGGENETDFDRELKKVIFSHVAEADRLEKASLDELIQYKTSEANDTIKLLKSELHRINEEIVALETQTRPEFQRNIENLLATKERELGSHEESKPKPVEQPQNDPGKQTEIASVAIEIEELKKTREQLVAQIAAAKESQGKYALQISTVEKLNAKLDNFKRQVDAFKIDSQSELQALGLTFEDVVKVSVDRSKLDSKKTEIAALKKKADDELNSTNADGAVFKKVAVEAKIAELQVKLDKPNQEYQAFVAAVETWTKKRSEIIGHDAAVGSITYLKRQASDLKGIPAKIALAKGNRLSQAKAVHAEIRKLSETYRSLYAPVHEFIETRPLARDKFHLNFEVAITDVGFPNDFFGLVSRAIAGTFCGTEEGEKALRSLLARHDFNTKAGMEAFLTEVMDSLENDKRSKEPTAVVVSSLLRKGKEPIDLYDFIFSLDYLRPRYTLRMGEKELHQLSPGERGTLLLVFYLLIDKGDIPLIIDQPEENLDNQTVFELLVPCIKEAKERRQIFIVTHNPNLAVVCDAEQVIGALLDKPDNHRMEYVAGAIENPKINRLILDILEGTRPAFDNRESKYLSEE